MASYSVCASADSDDRSPAARHRTSDPGGGWLLYRTGWDARSSSQERFLNADESGPHTPGISPECARWLAEEAPVIGIGVETVGTDAGAAHSFDPPFPCHSALLGSGKYGLTQLQNLAVLPPTGALLVAGPLPIVGGSGAPARVLALIENARVLGDVDTEEVLKRMGLDRGTPNRWLRGAVQPHPRMFFGLLGEADRTRLNLLILIRLRRNLTEEKTARTSGIEYLDQVIQSSADELREIANELEPTPTLMRLTKPHQELKRSLTALRRQAPRPHEETMQQMLAYCDTLRDQLHLVKKLAKSWKYPHQRSPVPIDVPQQGHLRVHNAWAILRGCVS